jgi:UDPglucose 6-dehydrogenase
MIIGIIGNGFVGKATKLLKCSIVEHLYVYDIIPSKCEPPNLPFNKLSECDLIFIALPTPMKTDGSCHLDIIEEAICDLKQIIDQTHTSVVLRSTVPPGTSDRFGVSFMPEFLTERDWQKDFITCKNWIFGCDPADQFFKSKINLLFQTAKTDGVIESDLTHFVSRSEAEMIKYVRNCFLATKVSFFNEIEEYTRAKNIDYETVRFLSTLDDRIGPSHTAVPGLDGHRGYGGTCFPKDTHALLFEMEKEGVNSHILKAIIIRNETVDRPEMDWKSDNGRAVI